MPCCLVFVVLVSYNYGMLTYLLNKVKLSNSVGNYFCYVDGRLTLMFLLSSAESNTSAFHPRICRCSCCWSSTCLVLIEQIMSIGIRFLFSVVMWYHKNMETDSFIVKESTMWICRKSLVVWCRDRRLTFLLFQVWDRRCFNARAAGVLTGHLEGITFLDSRGDGRYFISNGKDQTIKLWDIRKMSSNSTRYVLFPFWYLYWWFCCLMMTYGNLHHCCDFFMVSWWNVWKPPKQHRLHLLLMFRPLQVINIWNHIH